MRQNALPILEAYGVDLVLIRSQSQLRTQLLLEGHYGITHTFTEAMKKNGGDGRADGTESITNLLGIGSVKAPSLRRARVIGASRRRVPLESSGNVFLSAACSVPWSLTLIATAWTKIHQDHGTVMDYFTIVNAQHDPDRRPRNRLSLPEQGVRIAVTNLLGE